MGSICSTDKTPLTKVSESKIRTDPLNPLSKYSLNLPQEMTLRGVDTQVMIVSEGLAFNFLVKQGVILQKNAANKGDAIFFYSPEEKDFALKYSEIGMIGISDGNNDILEDAKLARVLFNLKTLWVFRGQTYKDDQLRKFVMKLNTMQVKAQQINLYPYPLQTLVEKYSLLNNEFSILKNFYPLQIFQSVDILSENTQINVKDDSFNLYLHGIRHASQISESAVDLYSMCLKVRNILFLFENIEIKIVKSLEMRGLYKVDVMNIKNEKGIIDYAVLTKFFIPYLSKLKMTNSSLLLVHDNQDSLLAIEAISSYLAKDLLIHQIDIEKYTQQRRAVIVVNGNSRVASQFQRKDDIQAPQQVVTLSRCDEIQGQYRLLLSTSKSSMISQSLHQTILKLMENIIQSPQDTKFRSIFTTNKRIQLNVLQYTQGIEILKICGFIPQPLDQPTVYVNQLEPGMLKLCRGDLELAFKQSQAQQ